MRTSFTLSPKSVRSVWLPFLHVGIYIYIFFLHSGSSPPKSLIAADERSNKTPYPLRKGQMSETTGCSNASFQGLPERLQEVIREKYVLSSSSSFRPPLDQPASVWEKLIFSLPSPPPLLFLLFFLPLLLRFHLRLVHPHSRAVLWDRKRKENS